MSKLHNKPKVQFSQETRDKGHECKKCHISPPDNLQVKYHFNAFGTHLNSGSGWWIRVDHHWEIGYHGERREKFDTVASILCPKCTKEHNSVISKLFEEEL